MSKILVFIEANKDKDSLKRASYEVITAARNLSKQISAEFHGITTDNNESALKSAGEFGLNKIIKTENDKFNDYSLSATAKYIKEVIKQDNYDLILFPANAKGKELAPRVSAALDAGYISDVIDLNNSDGIVAKKPVYAGKAIISTKVDTEVKVFSLRPNVFNAVKDDSVDTQIETKNIELNDSDFKDKVTSVVKNEGKLDVLEADIVVSGGRGIKGPENYNLIEDLASAFGGAVGASRAVVDAGWRPHNEQVGQTGKTVSPSLYVAVGISGAVQHLAGMSSSKTIVAINKDKDAPIFKVCDYGIVGDLFEVAPKLANKISEIKNN